MGVCVGCSAEVADDQLKDGMCPACAAKQGGEEATPAEGGDMGGSEEAAAAPAEGGDAGAEAAPAEGGEGDAPAA